MKEPQLTELLDKKIERFLNNIAIELETTHSRLFDDFGFPIFGETSKEYHEQVYFQSYLESYTRQMINSILKELIEDGSSDEFSWPEFEYGGICKGYTNTEYEKDFAFEFINRDKRIGYRYSSFYIDEIDTLLKKEGLEQLVLVKWEEKDEPIGIEYGDTRARVVLLWDLFHELLSELCEEEIDTTYNIFTKRVTHAIEQANSMISLTTLPGFTPSYLYRTREETMRTLQGEVANLSYFYVKNQKFKSTMDRSKELVEKYKLPKYFLEGKMEQVFCGSSKFAKSYLTSEYLYHYFNKNPLFDFTPIVSGYIKSVEQLLDVLCTSYRNMQHIYLKMGNYTLGNYIDYLSKNDNILRDTVRPAKDIIIDCLNSYRAESRNHLFHKDYLNTWERVKQIKENTIFLYVTLLGATDPHLLSNNPNALGVLDDEYDNLFHMLDKQNGCYFSFMLEGKYYTGMEKETRKKGLVFNKNGCITNEISFKKLRYDRYERIKITRYNMPSEIWISDFLGEKKNKIWPMI